MARPRKVFTVFWPEGFERFWVAYPLHVSKLDAQWAWTQAHPDEALLGTMLAALSWQRNQPAWTRADPAIPYGASWLRGQRWLDEPFNPPPVVSRKASLADHNDRLRREVFGG